MRQCRFDDFSCSTYTNGSKIFIGYLVCLVTGGCIITAMSADPTSAFGSICLVVGLLVLVSIIILLTFEYM